MTKKSRLPKNGFDKVNNTSKNADADNVTHDPNQDIIEERGSSHQPKKVGKVRLQYISDKARSDISEDTLDFEPYVRSLVNFLKSKDTEPPLAVAINGRWGRGKTSFMMMIDSELQKNKSSTFRFATTWFNPWKFSDADKVWASFVDNVTRCIRSSLGILPSFRFVTHRFFTKLKKQFNFVLAIRCVVLLAFVYLIYWITTDKNMANFTDALMLEFLETDTQKALKELPYKWFIKIVGALIIFYQLYFKVIKKFNLDLLEYLQKTNFRDKIGTLAQFDEEMKHLNSCIPKNLRIVVFIDDLDRCKPKVLLEIIEALQLLHVSERCIFVLGLDLALVAKTIEVGIPELRANVWEEGMIQHGKGYQFLEKIIHTRLNIPYCSQETIATFISDTINSLDRPNAYKKIELSVESDQQDITEDSPEVQNVINTYGLQYFRNPRRLKRFINFFRLHVHLAHATDLGESLDLIARFLILTERWPGMIEKFRKHPGYLDYIQYIWQVEKEDFKKDHLNKEDLNKDEKEFFNANLELFSQNYIKSLFVCGEDSINSKKLSKMCSWFGFQHYYTFNIETR